MVRPTPAPAAGPVYREQSIPVPGATLWRIAAGPATSLVLPDGCLDLLLLDGRLVVAGPDTASREAAVDRPVVGLRLALGRGPRLLGVPAHELTDTVVALDDLWGTRAARALHDRLRRDPGAWADWASSADDPPAAAVFTDAVAGHDVDTIARRAGVTTRTLLRRSRAAFGYGPQHLVRVLRLQRALALARADVPWADVAARTGYADQQHLARDARALTARTPSALLAQPASGANRSTGSPSGSRTVA